MPIIDVLFKIRGNEIPADHAYYLYSSLSKIVPFIHENSTVGIHNINGILEGERKLKITDKSVLKLRLNSDDLSQVLPIAGKKIKIATNEIYIGVPSSRKLIPASKLYSRLVIIKGFMEPEPFLEAVKRQFEKMNIKGKPYLVKVKGDNGMKYLRRTINVHGKEIVGFSVRVNELTADESITLQEKGIGGRRHFGCGIFVPDRS
ncbi:MAG: type I-MYXAN CRISPR-associated protein Cas6/Cmx6 [Candidatus Goldbacteria bacterium]|nr:type I-MYXAN CRISPR-associated protein Cas6/Cmx6 [Candidatus Goldiibacteriota bacterium]